MKSKAKSRSHVRKLAFTLVELLVVIAIIGILIALTIPAVQAAREAARRTQCANHLKQIGLAMHNYHVAHKKLPTNSIMFLVNDKTYPRYHSYGRGNYVVALLPYMEQQALYDDVMSSCSVIAGTISSPETQETCPWYKQVPTIRCPSDPAPDGYPAATLPGVAKNNYMISTGDWPEAHMYRLRDSDALKNYIDNPRSAFPMRTSSTYSTPNKSLTSVSDGLSNTIAVAEKCVGEIMGTTPSAGLNRKRSMISHHSSVAGGENNIMVNPVESGIPLECRDVKSNSEGLLSVNATGEAGGVRWADGIASFSSFSTILPPNAASCTASSAEPLDRVLSSASSEHPGGANTLRFDSSVTFVLDSVDTGKLELNAKNKGASNYGIWGASGSINGGESSVVP